jgi:P27 family predicted phage terminase small subunit
MPGPRPTPTHLKLLRGNPGHQKLNKGEPQPAQPPEPPEAPEFLTSYARDEWHRLAGELFRLKLLTVADIMPFAAYCVAYQHWRVAEEKLQAMAARDSVSAGLLLKRGDGTAGQNPLVRIAANAAADMVRFGAEFGLSPAARARISAGVGFEPPGGGKFGDLLA